MREDDEEEEEVEESNWFARWEEELPRPEDLMPLSQSLISSDLALAFGISSQISTLHRPSSPPPDLESADHSAPATDDSARTLKRPRLVWTPLLHKRFVDAVAHLGIKNAVPKTIMQLMSVDGLTRENVASHLQKYRLYLKRMQGHSSSPLVGPISSSDAATEQLFAGNPIPHHFLVRGSAGLRQDSIFQAMAPPMIQHQQHLAVQQQYYHQKQMKRFGSPVSAAGGFDCGFRARGPRPPAGLRPSPSSAVNSYDDDDDGDSKVRGARRVLTLFPT